MRTTDGLELFVHDWPVAPGMARRGSLLIVHGFGEHGGRYLHVAERLNGLGLAVRCHDQRGFGRSEGRNGVLPHADALLEDAVLAFETLARDAERAGDRSAPFLLGHSMGGTIAARLATSGRVGPRGLILSSPGLAVRLTLPQRLQLGLGRALMPDLAMPSGLATGHISHDPAVVAAYDADPLVHDRISARLARFIIDAGEAARRDAGRLPCPVLMLLAGDDKLVDAEGSRAFAASIPPGLGTVHWYDGLYHEVLNERPADRARVLDDLARWLEQRLSA